MQIKCGDLLSTLITTTTTNNFSLSKVFETKQSVDEDEKM